MNILIASQIYILILHRPPQALREDIVHTSSFAIHADPDFMRIENIDVLGTREMAALVIIA